MKKAIILLMAILMMLPTIVYANDATSAENINLDSSKSHRFCTDYENSYFDYEYYYKFTPVETCYYEVEVKNFVKDESYITICNSLGREIAFSGWDQYSNSLRCATKMDSGETYYIQIQIFEGDVTATTNVKKHAHTFDKSPSSDGYKYEECICKGCDFVRYVVTYKPSKVKATAGRKSFTVRFNNKYVLDGYQVQYSTSKKFKNAKIKNIAMFYDNKKVTGLKKNKTYYFRVRGKLSEVANGISQKYYGPWSSMVKVKTH